jgi:hypothetical protein
MFPREKGPYNCSRSSSFGSAFFLSIGSCHHYPPVSIPCNALLFGRTRKVHAPTFGWKFEDEPIEYAMWSGQNSFSDVRICCCPVSLCSLVGYVLSHVVETYFCFFSAGLRIWNEHNKLSSTLIIAPALSNSPQ